MSKNRKKQRTYARNRPVVSRRGLENLWESDGVYVLKLVLVTLGGLMWVRLSHPILVANIPVGAFPAGSLITALLLAWRERAQFNRKIMYAVLVVVTIIGFFVDAGIVI
ncbi:hypothetical protein GX865_01220 [Candidatus Saccharibacteria bacterium]|jgi:hypothetical protein|nr:hypothetical protein [Candidatus Saccharibacteria bacterium]